jgi:hypothetical protein
MFREVVQDYTDMEPFGQPDDRWYHEATNSEEESDDPLICAEETPIWKLDNKACAPERGETSFQLKNAFLEQAAVYAVTSQGRARLNRTRSRAAPQKREFVTIGRDQFDALLHRLEVLESKAGVVRSNTPAITPENKFDISSVTRDLFSVNPTIEQIRDANNDDHYYRVTISIGDADPKHISDTRSKWHDLIMGLSIPKELRDNIRLKVVYE